MVRRLLTEIYSIFYEYRTDPLIYFFLVLYAYYLKNIFFYVILICYTIILFKLLKLLLWREITLDSNNPIDVLIWGMLWNMKNPSKKYILNCLEVLIFNIVFGFSLWLLKISLLFYTCLRQEFRSSNVAKNFMIYRFLLKSLKLMKERIFPLIDPNIFSKLSLKKRKIIYK